MSSKGPIGLSLKIVTVTEARRDFFKLFKLAEKGENIIIHKRGSKAKFKLVRLGPAARRSAPRSTLAS